MDQTTSGQAVPLVDSALFAQAWRLGFGGRGNARLALPTQRPFIEALRAWHDALRALHVPEAQWAAFDQRLLVLAVDSCREPVSPCCIADEAVRAAALRPLVTDKRPGFPRARRAPTLLESNDACVTN